MGHMQGMDESVLKYLEEHSKDFDTDGSGTIDYTEFIAATIERNNLSSDACIRAAFNVIDTNGDGQITKEELRAKINEVDDELLKMISAYDKDGDGQISFEEFKHMIKE